MGLEQWCEQIEDRRRKNRVRKAWEAEMYFLVWEKPTGQRGIEAIGRFEKTLEEQSNELQDRFPQRDVSIIQGGSGE